MAVQEILSEKVGFVEGVIDTGIVVIAHFRNPARKAAFDFLSGVLRWERRCLIPTSTFLGAYHIMTEYLGVDRVRGERTLKETLQTRSPAFYEDVTIDQVLDALMYAGGYHVESWDGYIVSLARNFGAPIIYTTDRELAQKVEGIEGINPIPRDTFTKYNKWLKKKLSVRER